MGIKLGIIADDFTGATDIASFIALSGWRVIQLNGIPDAPVDTAGLDALVISLKSRSCPASDAVELSKKAARWLLAQGCQRLYFKYCSTFDSTELGNIGPVTDMLLAETNIKMAVLCPALPVNERVVFQGHLFVKGQLLNESGMQNHPLTPMKDANLKRFMEKQASGSCGLVSLQVINRGTEAIQAALNELEDIGKRYAILDAVTDEDLIHIAAALPEKILLTGGSGLAGALASLQPNNNQNNDDLLPQKEGRSVILAGSCSNMTNRQVGIYRERSSSIAIDVERAINDSENYLQELIDWYQAQPVRMAPIIYATRQADEVREMQQRFGIEKTGAAIENLLAALAVKLNELGVNKIIVAGGETSSLIVQRLNVTAFAIGNVIAPGVPWIKDVRRPLWLTLKSGNFGDENFFSKAQETYS